MLRIRSLSPPMRRLATRDDGTLQLKLRRIGTPKVSISLRLVCGIGWIHTVEDTRDGDDACGVGWAAQREALAVMRAASPFGLELKQIIFDATGRDHGADIGFDESASAALERAVLALALAAGSVAPTLQAAFNGQRMQAFGLDDVSDSARRTVRRDLKSALVQAGAVHALWTTTRLQTVESHHQRIALKRELATRRRAARRPQPDRPSIETKG